MSCRHGGRRSGMQKVFVHQAERRVAVVRLRADFADAAWLKEKANTWNKSCTESAKRESELYKMIELTAIDERQKHKGRSMLMDLIQQLQKAREEEEEARGLIEEMQRNLDEAHETERKLGPVLGEHVYSYEKEMERPHSSMDKMW